MIRKIDIAFATGGTGGHAYPVVALIQELTDVSALCLCTENREDVNIVRKHKLVYLKIPFSKKNILKLIKGFFKARNILKHYQVKALVSSGSANTVMIAIAAYSLRVPIILLEQNTIPGRTNRLLEKLSKKILVSFEESKKFFSANKAIFTGNPIRKVFLEDKYYKAFQKIKLSSSETILVFGGSQGALAINKIIYENYSYFLKKYNIIHLTGESFYKSKFREGPFEIIKEKNNCAIIFPYFEKIDTLYSASEYVICRAGATTVAELVNFGQKAILIPYPYAKDNHQAVNARAFQKTGLGAVVAEQNLNLQEICIGLDFLKSLPEKKADKLRARELAANEIRQILVNA
jgi:UDP-N-acetylglucosamine--N-acetylmuramyl-(pentapeptide) pyrophosphoryl-undecaprenol N-acetylglucosamine transferase